MLDSFLARIGSIAAGVGLFVIAATVQLGGWLLPVLGLATISIVGGLLGVTVIAVKPTWKLGRGWVVGRGAPDLDIEPTGGSSPDLRIVVTNRGRKTDFHGTAGVVAARNYPNSLHEGSYSLMWLGRGTNILSLDRGQSHALMLARFLIHYAPLPRMGEAQLIECNGSQEARWDGFRWIMQPNEALTEFDIDVTIVGSGFAKSIKLSYTLRPAAWIGPLELIERVPA